LNNSQNPNFDPAVCKRGDAIEGSGLTLFAYLHTTPFLESLMNTQSFELTMEQQFQMKLMEDAAQNMSHDQVLDMLTQTMRLMMVKDNVIRSLVKGCLV
jgi:Phycobilisome degradation protein nblA